MDKILVQVICPPMGKEYDFWVSHKMPISKAKEKIIGEIRELEKSNTLFSNGDNVSLFRKADASILSDVLTFEQEHIASGDVLTLL